MVFFSLNLFSRSRGPDELWRKRKIFKIVSHFRSRRRNCYSLSIRSAFQSLLFSTRGRKLKKQDMREIWERRTISGVEEHGLQSDTFKEGLTRCNILLNRKTLADLAVWEPRTFKSLASIAYARANQDGFKHLTDSEITPNVITNGTIK